MTNFVVTHYWISSLKANKKLQNILKYKSLIKYQYSEKQYKRIISHSKGTDRYLNNNVLKTTLFRGGGIVSNKCWELFNKHLSFFLKGFESLLQTQNF